MPDPEALVTLLDNASILNACGMVTSPEPSAIGLHDLGAMVSALMIGDRIETLGGRTYDMIVRSGTGHPAWDLSSPRSLFASLRSLGLLELRTMSASWHHYSLEDIDRIDELAATVDVEAQIEQLKHDFGDSTELRRLTFGIDMVARDSNPIYCAPKSGAPVTGPVPIDERRTDPLGLFVSQTLLYCYESFRSGLPLMASSLRRAIVAAVWERGLDRTHSTLRDALTVLDSTARKPLEEVAELLPSSLEAVRLPPMLSYVLSESSSREEILRVALECRDERDVRQFREWFRALGAAAAATDLRTLRRLLRQQPTGSRARSGLSAGRVVVGFATSPTTTAGSLVALGVDEIVRLVRPRIGLLSALTSGHLSAGSDLDQIARLWAHPLPRSEQQRLVALGRDTQP